MNLSTHIISISLLLMLVGIHNGNTSFIDQETDQKTMVVDSKIWLASYVINFWMIVVLTLP